MNARTLPVLMLCAALTGACTTMTPIPAANLPVFLGLERVDIKREYLDRYACRTGEPLHCSCPSTMIRSATCRCGCPTF